MMHAGKEAIMLLCSLFLLPTVLSQGFFVEWNVSSSAGWDSAPRAHDLNMDRMDEVIAIASGSPPTLKCFGANGKLQWQSSLQGSDGAGVALGDLDGDFKLEVVAASSSYLGSALFAFKADGKPLWRLDLEGLCTARPVVFDLDWDGCDEVLVADEGRGLHVVDGRTGSILWTVEKRMASESIISVADLGRTGKLTVLWFQNKTGSVWLIDAETREIRTLNKTQDQSYFGWPMLGDVDADGFLDLVICTSDNVVCLNSLSLSIRWMAEVPSRFSSAMGDVDLDGSLEILVPGNGKITCLDAHGHVKYETSVTEGTWIGSIVLGDIDGDGIQEAIFSAHQTQMAYAMDARTGALKYSFFSFLGGSFDGRFPAAIADGDWDGVVEVYCPTVRGMPAPLYALTCGERGASWLEWPQLSHDWRNTANYETTMRTVFEPDLFLAVGLTIPIGFGMTRNAGRRLRTALAGLRPRRLRHKKARLEI